MYNVDFSHYIQKEYLREEDFNFLSQCQFMIESIEQWTILFEMDIPSTENYSRYKISKNLFRLVKKILLQNPKCRILHLNFKGTNEGYYVNDLIDLLFLYNRSEPTIGGLKIVNKHPHDVKMRIGQNFANSNLSYFEISFDKTVELIPGNMLSMFNLSLKINDIQSFNAACEKARRVTIFLEESLSGLFSKYYRVEDLTIITSLKLCEIENILVHLDETVKVKLIWR